MKTEAPKNGLHTEYYDNGQKKQEDHYKDGKLDGKATSWHENGQIKHEVNFKDGKVYSNLNSWYENGQKELEGNYKGGIPYGKWTWWYENGQKSKERNYINDKRHGKVTGWYESGQKKEEENWLNGNKIGKYTEWHENGQKKYEGNYKHDKLDGKVTRWHEDGQLESEATFVNDKIILDEEGIKKKESAEKIVNEILVLIERHNTNVHESRNTFLYWLFGIGKTDEKVIEANEISNEVSALVDKLSEVLGQSIYVHDGEFKWNISKDIDPAGMHDDWIKEVHSNVSFMTFCTQGGFSFNPLADLDEILKKK